MSGAVKKECSEVTLPEVSAQESELEARVEAVVDGYADAALAFVEGFGPATTGTALALIAAYLQTAGAIHAAELAAGAGRVPPCPIA